MANTGDEGQSILSREDYAEIKHDERRRRVRWIVALLVIAAIPLVVLIHHERGVSPLGDDRSGENEFCWSARVGQRFLVEASAANLTSDTLTLRRLTYAYGVPPEANLEGEGATSSVEGMPSCVSNQWFGTAPHLKPIAGFRLRPHRNVYVFDRFKFRYPGYYRFLYPVVHVDRPGLWRYVPGVGSAASYTNQDANDAVCVSLSDWRCSLSEDIAPDDASVGGRQVLGLRWYLNPQDRKSTSGLTGYFAEDLSDGTNLHVWYTERRFRGRYESPILNITKRWTFRVSVSCPGKINAPVKMWSIHPDGTHRAYFPPIPGSWKHFDKHWRVDQRPYSDSHRHWSTDNHDLGKVRIHFYSKCPYTVAIYGMPGPQHL